MKSIWNLPFIFGLVATLIGVALLMSQFIKKMTCTEQTEGVIRTAYEKRMGINIPYPEIAYKVNERAYTKPFSGSDKITAGDNVTVCYNPSNPKKFYVLEDNSNMVIVGVAFVIGGIVFMLIGYGLKRGLF